MKQIVLFLFISLSIVSQQNAETDKESRWYCEDFDIYAAIYQTDCDSICKVQLGCQHSCYLKKDVGQLEPHQGANASFYVCGCMNGYSHINATHCERIHGCSRPGGTPYCTQTCIDKKMGKIPACGCQPGYSLQSDGRSCRAKRRSAILYYTNGNEIRAYELESERQSSVVKTPNVPGSTQTIIALERMADWLFYVVESADSELESNPTYSVYKVNLDDGRQSKLALDWRFSAIRGIALDWLQRRIYIAGLGQILVCSIEPYYCRTLPLSLDALASNDSIGGLAVSPLSGQLYLAETLRPGRTSIRLYQAPLNGTSLTKLTHNQTIGMYSADGFSLDPTGQWLTWYDALKQELQFCKIQSRQCGRFLKAGLFQYPAPYSIGLYEHTIYYASKSNHSIKACALTDDNECQEARTLFRAQPDDEDSNLGAISIYYDAHQNLTLSNITNPCSNAKCSHFCFIENVYSSKNISCACPDGYRLRPDGFTCQNKLGEQFLLLSAGDRIVKLYPHPEKSFVVQEMIHFDEKRSIENEIYVPVVEAMAYNFARDELYLLYLLHLTIDGSRAFRWIVSMNESARAADWPVRRFGNLTIGRKLVYENLHQIRAMVYDVNTDMLYWVDEARGRLDAVATQHDPLTYTAYYRTTLRADLEKPISLALDAKDRYWFIGLRDAAQIIRLDMDGNNRQLIVPGPGGFATSLAFNSAHKFLLWTNSTWEATNNVLAHLMGIFHQNLLPEIDFYQYKRPTVRDDSGPFHSLTIFNKTAFYMSLYWMDNAGRLIQSDGSRLSQVAIHKLLGLEAYQIEPVETRLISGEPQPLLHDHCRPGRHQCEWPALCLLSNQANRGYSCSCPNGVTPRPDGFSCKELTDNDFGNTYQDVEQDVRQANEAWERHEIRSYRLAMKAKQKEILKLNLQNDDNDEPLSDNSTYQLIKLRTERLESVSEPSISKSIAVGLILLVLIILSVAWLLMYRIKNPNQIGISACFERIWNALRLRSKERPWRAEFNSNSLVDSSRLEFVNRAE